MAELRLEGLNALVAKRADAFFRELLKSTPELIHSLHLVGSAVTEDFDEQHSDINSVVVLNRIDFGFLRFLGSIGTEHRKAGIAAPLVATPEGILDSLDVFPIEYLDFRTVHRTVFGTDLFETLRIEPAHLRLQCEREIKTRLIGLRQGYVSSLGKAEIMQTMLSRSVAGMIPLLRGIIYLLGQEPPARRREVITAFASLTEERCRQSGQCINTSVFERALDLKLGILKASPEDLHATFEGYYRVFEALGRLVNELSL